MQTIELEGSGWQSERDFYDALAATLGIVEWHGRNADAFLETMIYELDLSRFQPPYELIVRNPPEDLRPFLQDFSSGLRKRVEAAVTIRIGIAMSR